LEHGAEGKAWSRAQLRIANFELRIANLEKGEEQKAQGIANFELISDF
jgi:hypothetical protein